MTLNKHQLEAIKDGASMFILPISYSRVESLYKNKPKDSTDQMVSNSIIMSESPLQVGDTYYTVKEFECSHCKGTGYDNSEKCSDCYGAGKVQDIDIEVLITNIDVKRVQDIHHIDILRLGSPESGKYYEVGSTNWRESKIWFMDWYDSQYGEGKYDNNENEFVLLITHDKGIPNVK